MRLDPRGHAAKNSHKRVTQRNVPPESAWLHNKKTKIFNFSEASTRLRRLAALEARNNLKMPIKIISISPKKNAINLIKKPVICFASKNRQENPESHYSLGAFTLEALDRIKRLGSKIVFFYYDYVLERRAALHFTHNALKKHPESKVLSSAEAIISFEHFIYNKPPEKTCIINCRICNSKKQTERLIACNTKINLALTSSALERKSRSGVIYNQIFAYITYSYILTVSPVSSFIKARNTDYTTKNFITAADVVANKYRLYLENLAKSRTKKFHQFHQIKKNLSRGKILKRNSCKSLERS